MIGFLILNTRYTALCFTNWYSYIQICKAILLYKFGVPGSQQPGVNYYVSNIVPWKTSEISEKCSHAVQTCSSEQN